MISLIKNIARIANAVQVIVVTTGIEPSSNIGNALVSAMCGRSSELGLYSILNLRISV